MVPLLEIYTYIDDFCKVFEQELQKNALPRSKLKRKSRMSLSEIMTILIMFHLSKYRTFKDFYLNSICCYYTNDFKDLLSYNRFVELMPSALAPMFVMLHGLEGQKTGKYFVDSTKLVVCHNLRIVRNKVFKGCAKRGKTSTGWFFGFKLHLILNDQGEIMNFKFTTGNTDDRSVVEEIAKKLKGWLFGDRGYISKKLNKSLQEQGLELITTLKHNMKKQIIAPLKKYYLSKRGIIETVIDQLKNLLHLDHTRHRSVLNFQVNAIGAMIAYAFKPKKVSIKFHQQLERFGMPISSN